MTSDYTFVAPERQNELTRRIQEKLSAATMKLDENTAGVLPPVPPAPVLSPSLATAVPATRLLQ
jgi:hypothetical protein